MIRETGRSLLQREGQWEGGAVIQCFSRVLCCVSNGIIFLFLVNLLH